MKIAIIGSAGRGMDQAYVTKTVWEKMVKKALWIIRNHWEIPKEETNLISGGAAFADHVAVSLFLLEEADTLDLELPTTWDWGSKCFLDTGTQSPGRVANYWHRQFSKKIAPGRSENQSLETLDSLLEHSRVSYRTYDGFKARNLAVANCDRLIAFTFYDGNKPKPGSGTVHTWNNSVTTVKTHVNLFSL